MLRDQIRQIVEANPDYAAITPVIEKEILHHDVLSVMIEYGAMERLTFIGGTSLRLCFNSARLSEDLDFNAGYDFKPSDLLGLALDLEQFITSKYETDVRVNQPSEVRQGDTVSWTLSIEKEPNRPDIPRQKIHIDVCAIPSFDVEKRPLMNHYQLNVPTDGLLIPVQSLDEALVDKVIAFAFRARRIKPRDVWDLVWIQQRGIELSHRLLAQKLDVRRVKVEDFHEALAVQLEQLLHHEQVQVDFQMEMSRFIAKTMRERTIDTPEYWIYVQAEVERVIQSIIRSH